MAIVHPHNLRNPDAAIQRPYGVRITLKAGDPFRKLLGADWNKTHWYGTAAERDAALIEMARKHEYSRPGDKPALKFDKECRLVFDVVRELQPELDFRRHRSGFAKEVLRARRRQRRSCQ